MPSVGSDVTNPPEPGSLVTVNPVIGCGSCTECRAGEPQRCARRKVIGVAPDISSAFAELMVAPAGNVVSVDGLHRDSLGRRSSSLWPSVTTLLAALALVPGDRVLVIGGGPIGQAAALGVLRHDCDRVLVC